MRRFLVATGFSALLAGAAFAADVKVTGAHNCCGMCANILNQTLATAGAKNAQVGKTEITFSADTAEAADKIVKALFDAGFAGKVEGAKTPAPEGTKDVKSKTIKLTNVHNCCGACTRAITAALRPFGACDARPRETTVTLTAETEVEAEKVVAALRAIGYNARVAK